jgi:hypothetical protein
MCSTRVLLLPHCLLEDAVLRVDIIHANVGNDFNPLVSSTRLPLREVLEERLGSVATCHRDLRIKQPSDRPHGRIDVHIIGSRRLPAVGIRT